MLQRSRWSALLLSAAVGTSGVLGITAAMAQERFPPDAVGAPVAAPATAPAAMPDAAKLAAMAEDFMHYSLVNNTELAKANADALIAANVPPEQILAAFETSKNGRDPRQIMIQDQRRDELKDSATQLLAKLEDGYRAVARDPKRIRDEVDRLAGGPRPYQNARERLTAAGQFAAPIFLEYLQNSAKKDLHPYILRVMGEIGRPLLLPLVEELRVTDPILRVEVVNVIGQIGYPQALPALRAIQADPSTVGELKNAVDKAIGLIDRTGAVSTMAASDLNLRAAQNYYDKKASYQPLLPDEKTNPIWVFDQGLNNVTAINVPTPIWNSVMALRLAEATLRADPDNGDAVSLWLAASIRREIQLPAGTTDPTRGTGPSASFYAVAAGPKYANPVLGKALDAHDAALALQAIDALEATGGATGLVSGGEGAPLVRALSYPDRSVRFRAAFALARANPTSQFASYYRVVPILCEAVNSTGSPTALVIAPDEDARNKLTEVLRTSAAHYTVFAGATLSDALEQARRAASVDVIIVPSGPEVDHVVEIAKTDYRLTGSPVLVTAASAELPGLRSRLDAMKGYAAINVAADEDSFNSALTTARAEVGNVPLDADKATQFAATALDLLGSLAADHHSIFSVSEAVPTLSDALKDKRPEVATAAARDIGKINSPEGERALAAVALAPDVDAALRIPFFDALAESAKRTGNVLDASVVNSLIKVVAGEPDAKVRQSAATALGALNVASNQASSLILQGAK